MRIHKEGKIIILVALLLVFLINNISLYFFGNLGLLIVIPSIVILFFVIWFFRNPVRTNNAESLDVIAPVDGKVVIIKKVFVDEFLQKEAIQVSIFMSPLNVHVCRYPVFGKVLYTKHHYGKYLVAWHEKSSELNERTTVVVETPNHQQVLFRQIAGYVARRIVLYAKPNDEAKAGEEYGFIKFGSRLDVFLPLDAEILVKTGDVIPNGGEKVIARLKS